MFTFLCVELPLLLWHAGGWAWPSCRARTCLLPGAGRQSYHSAGIRPSWGTDVCLALGRVQLQVLAGLDGEFQNGTCQLQYWQHSLGLQKWFTPVSQSPGSIPTGSWLPSRCFKISGCITFTYDPCAFQHRWVVADVQVFLFCMHWPKAFKKFVVCFK